MRNFGTSVAATLVLVGAVGLSGCEDAPIEVESANDAGASDAHVGVDPPPDPDSSGPVGEGDGDVGDGDVGDGDVGDGDVGDGDVGDGDVGDGDVGDGDVGDASVDMDSGEEPVITRIEAESFD